MANTAKKSSTPAAKEVIRPAYTIERARLLCPTVDQAERLAVRFALEPVDFHEINDATQKAITESSNAIESAMNEQALEIHLQRIVGAFVASACGAGDFYSAKVTLARELTTRLSNDSRDEDRDGIAGFDSKATRAREFAAQVGLQAMALLAAAEGAVTAFAAITGTEWRPYSRTLHNDKKVDRLAAEAQMQAFD